MPPGADLPLPDGSADYFDLFDPDADWSDALARVDAFKLHAWQIRHFLSDEQLSRILTWLDENDIALMFETEPLDPPDPAECDHTESFEGPYDLEMARRIRDLGGTIAVAAIEEPFAFAHKLAGPGSCQYSVERIVDEVIDYITELRTIFPGVPVGTIEPIWRTPPTTADDMALWLDTYLERSGEPFAFLHLDPDWVRSDWAQVALEIEAVADERGVPFGVLYNGGLETEGGAWLQVTMEHIATFEVRHGGTPQHIAFQSWVDQPDRVIPDSDLSAFTSILNRYFGVRTEVESSLDFDLDGAGRVRAQLTSDVGDAIAGEPIVIGLRPLTGELQTHSVTGTVPASSRTAVIAIRVNAEDAVPGEADVRLAEVAYEEAADGVNLVSNPGFDRGLLDWGGYGERSGEFGVISDGGGESWLALSAAGIQQIFIDSVPFAVTPGEPYEFRVVLGVPEASIGTAVIAVVFLNEQEVMRHTIRFEPRLDLLAPALTDESGVAVVTIERLEPGRYEVETRYDGDLERWPSSSHAVVDVS